MDKCHDNDAVTNAIQTLDRLLDDTVPVTITYYYAAAQALELSDGERVAVLRWIFRKRPISFKMMQRLAQAELSRIMRAEQEEITSHAGA